MAFNLNKTEGANTSPKFDLSKNSSAGMAGAANEKTRPTTWRFVLLALLAAGIAAWYFYPGSGDTKQPEKPAAAAPVDTPTNTRPTNEVTAVTLAGSDSAKAVPVQAAEPASIQDAGSLSNRVPAKFAKGSTAISSLDQSLVQEIIRYLQKNPAASVIVNGYASSEGALEINQSISQSRAAAFKAYLVKEGISASRISAKGRGIENPVGDNSSEEGRISNRRVEIVFQ